MSPAAQALWRYHVGAYRRRGQAVAGCEGLLRSYCELGARMTAMRAAGEEVSASMYGVYLGLCREFFDTPASFGRASGG
jgi:hypothetical protein